MATKLAFKWSNQLTPCQVEQLIRAERSIEKASAVFDSATAEYVHGYKHNEKTFGIMISRLASANRFKAAESLLDRMKEENCAITENVCLSICRAYGRVHRAQEALRVFDRMKELPCELTAKSYITLFDILVTENHLKQAFKFYDRMKADGIRASTTAINILIKALCKSNETIHLALKVFKRMSICGCAPDSYTYGTMINGLCKLGEISKARSFFKKMQLNGLSPSVITYTSLIRGLCLSNKLDEANDLMQEMSSKNVEPNVVTYTSVMDGLCKNGRSSEAVVLLEEMMDKRQQPNHFTYCTLISGLCKENKLQEALKIMDMMKLHGCNPDAALYSNLVSCLCDTCKFEEAANFLDEMILAGVSPNHLTKNLHSKMYNMVVKGLCDMKLLDRAFRMYLGMRTRGVSIMPDTFHVLVDSYCKKGNVYQAARLVNEMFQSQYIPDAATWFVIVSGFWDRKKTREEANLIQDKLKTEILAYS